MQFSLSLGMEYIHIYILAFYGQVQFLGYWTKGRDFGPRASLDKRRQLAWQATSYNYEYIVRQQIMYFSFESTVSPIIFDSTSYMYVLDKRNILWLRNTVRQTGGRWLPSGCLHDTKYSFYI